MGESRFAVSADAAPRELARLREAIDHVDEVLVRLLNQRTKYAIEICRIKGVKMKGVRLGNWLSIRQAQELLNVPDATTNKGRRDRAIQKIASIKTANKRYCSLGPSPE